MDWQTPTALLVVALTGGLFLWRLVKKRKSPSSGGCGAGCGCDKPAPHIRRPGV